jgi:hypothetical protein
MKLSGEQSVRQNERHAIRMIERESKLRSFKSCDGAVKRAKDMTCIHRSAKDAYSSTVPDPTFAVVGVHVALHSILKLPFGI